MEKRRTPKVSDFHYYGARYYASELSMWLSTDPMSDNAPAWTSYVYCFNNPIKFIDPNGKWPWSTSVKKAKKYAKKHGGVVESWIGKNGAIWSSVNKNYIEHNEVNISSKVFKPTLRDKISGFVKSFNSPIHHGSNMFYQTYLHYQIGHKRDFYVDASTLDISYIDQSMLRKARNNYSINLFDYSKTSQSALALGKITLTPEGNNMFKIADDHYDFNIEWNNGLTFRNFATLISGLVHGPVIDNEPIPIFRIASIFPIFGPSVYMGGSFTIRFQGSVYIKPKE
ncbi:MAG: RHS repeat domain-containing protein [Bacteroidales bacterium]